MQLTIHGDVSFYFSKVEDWCIRREDSGDWYLYINDTRIIKWDFLDEYDDYVFQQKFDHYLDGSLFREGSIGHHLHITFSDGTCSFRTDDLTKKINRLFSKFFG